MADFLKHECGVAVIRLRKPLAWYLDRHGSTLWGFNKLFLLMEKQHNRGQDGVGIGCVKLGMPLGEPYMFRKRDAQRDSLAEVFRQENRRFGKLGRRGRLDPHDPVSVKREFHFGGEILLGHLRYGTSGQFDQGACHPYMRRSNWPTRSLMVMGNFNMTNTGQLNEVLMKRGQHPVFGTDTQTVLEEIGFHLDEAHTELYRRFRDEGLEGRQIQERITGELRINEIVGEAAKLWDGAYAICGAIGSGEMFVMRDPHGIRPCHVLVTDEVIAFASERVPLMTVFEAEEEDVREVTPGTIATVSADGEYWEDRFAPETDPRPCSFERIYFSRGNDPRIYRERKALGAALVPQLLRSINGRFDRAVFSFIPNTAEIAYHGMMDGLRIHRREEVRTGILAAAAAGTLDARLLDELILSNWPRGEKVAHKDIKMRTFITREDSREQLVSHVYDITYGVVGDDEVLVVLDDSIVRGTTLKQSIIKILARTRPRKIVICSTAPQIRYPDCYGIDMSELGQFIAFQAAVTLHRRANRQPLLDRVYDACRAELAKPRERMANRVKEVYEAFDDETIAAEVARMVYPEDIGWHGEVEVVYQTIANLRQAIEGPCGDWYFTGDYPTPGGYATANAAYVAWYDGIHGRSYDLPL